MKTNQHQRKSPEFVSKVFGLRTFHPFTPTPHNPTKQTTPKQPKKDNPRAKVGLPLGWAKKFNAQVHELGETDLKRFAFWSADRAVYN